MPNLAYRVIGPDLTASLSAAELLANNIEISRLETIATSRIIVEDSLIDLTHASDLAASMNGKRGQISPITARARFNDKGEIVYDIIDGFHRTEAKRLNGDPEINAKVVYGCSDEELYDLRILASGSVRAVQFARVAKWITSSYETTPWAKMGLNIYTAFSITQHNNVSTLSRNVTPDDVSELKAWVRAKCTKWGRPVGTVRNELLLIANSDPGLVKEVRNVTGGSEGETSLTQGKLGVVVKIFRKEPNFGIQRAILHFAIQNRVNVKEIEALTNTLVNKVSAGMSEEEARRIVEEVFPKLPRLAARSKTNITEDSPSLNEGLPDGIEDEEFDFGNVSPNGKRAASHTPLSAYFQMRTAAYGQGDIYNEAVLTARIQDLEAAISASKVTSEEDTWWRSVPYLTPLERICIERGIYGAEDIDQLTRSINILPRQLESYITSALTKRHLLDH